MDLPELQRVVFPAHERGEYEVALDAVERYEPTDPDEVADVAFWRMCLLSLLGRKDEALVEFARRIDEGLWWGEVFLADHDLDAVRDDSEWQRLAAVSIARAEEATTGPLEPLDVRPDGETVGTLVLLHGFGWRPQSILDRYRPALGWGYRLVALHGTVPVAAGRFAWPAEGAETVAIGQLHQIGDPERPIFSGFSQGAGVAVRLAWSGRVDTAGVFLVAPAFGPRGAPTPDTVQRPVPTVILAGSEDRRIDKIRRVSKDLQALGTPVRYDERRGLGHDWPGDFAETLKAALAWIRAEL
ncbi:alpha/beta hydrolase family protein [bacterium BMS3Bbin01]|nr:alpha/beta hydrolase family protein [bacterium BMS3Bbin01]